MLKQIWGIGYLLGTLSIFASDKSKRIEITGPFTVCPESHFMHQSCYDGWGRECPSCKCLARELVQVDTAFFLEGSKEECVFCMESYDAKPGGVALLRPSSPAITKIPSIKEDLRNYQAVRQLLLQDIKAISNPVEKVTALRFIKSLHSSKFRHEKRP